MICNSWWGFEFSWLNSLLSWAFSQQDKNIKINGIISGSVTFKLYESYIWALNYVACVSLSCIGSFQFITNFSKKYDKTSINLTVFDHGLTTLLSIFHFSIYLFIHVNVSVYKCMMYKWFKVSVMCI